MNGAGLHDEAFAWPEDAVEVGRVVGAWGVKGGLRVHSFSTQPEALFSSRRWFLQPALRSGLDPRPKRDVPGSANASSLLHWPLRLSVRNAREQGGDVVCTALEVGDRTMAEALKGARIFVRRQDFPTLADDQYYWVDLIGLSVVNRAGEALGEVMDLLSNGPQSILRIGYDAVDAKGVAVRQERLIPFVGAYIDQVDLSQRTICVDWGLDY